jgi:gluconokinase
MLYEGLGREVQGAEGRSPYQMKIMPDGGVEMDADELLEMTCANIDLILCGAGSLQIGAVACSTFWHSLLGLGKDERPVTPIYNWNDTRSRTDAATLSQRLGADWMHARTGALPHSSYYPAKLCWLRRTRPDQYARAARWVSFGEYLHLRLFGRTLCSVSMASGTGLFNPNTCAWDREVLEGVGVEPERLSPVAEDGASLTGLRSEYQARWPALREVPWMAALGDGACSNVGSGCVTRDRVALMVGTSGAMRVCWQADRVQIPPGLWCYRVNRRYTLLGGALSNAGDAYAWCQSTLRLDAADIEATLTEMLPDGHGLTVLPFFSGERSTGWADHARAAVTGISLNTRPSDILRAVLEAVAYRFAAIYESLSDVVSGKARIIATGAGMIHSPAWTQMMADVVGAPVVASLVPEASSRGAALLALQSLGHLDDLSSLPVPLGAVHEPNPVHHQRYLEARRRQEALYHLLVTPGGASL